MSTDILIIILSLLFSAFFSGMEIAFVSSNKFIIELEKKKGLFTARIISSLSRNPGLYIATMLVGNNIALVIYGLLMAKVLEPLIMVLIASDVGVLTIQTLFSTLIILITAEFLPKTLFRNNANTALNIFAVPVAFIYLVLFPITRFTTAITQLILKSILKVDVNAPGKKFNFGKIDLDNYISESQQKKENANELQHDIVIFQNALDFSNVKLRECIVPRPEIVACEKNQGVDELIQKFIETGYSKIPIFEDSIDNIIGYVHSLEMFKKPAAIIERLIKIPIVPETMTARKLLQIFIQEHKSIALVVDEFGGTAGIITLEDIVEEIFGEIEDEHDSTELVERKISEKEFVLSGRCEIDYLNDKFNLNLPKSEEYETLAGFIFRHHHNVPVNNQVIQIPPYTMKILKASQTRIELVNIKIS